MLPENDKKRNALLPSAGFLKFYRSTKIQFADRLVWSWLVYRDRYNETSSASEIAVALTLDRHAVAGSLNRLVKLKLAEPAASKWRACKPSEAFFPRMKSIPEGEHWSSVLPYDRLLFPDFLDNGGRFKVNGRRLTVRHTALLAILISFQERGERTTKTGLAKLLGLGRRTVCRLADDLTASGIMKLESTGHWFKVLVNEKVKTPEAVIYRQPTAEPKEEKPSIASHVQTICDHNELASYMKPAKFAAFVADANQIDKFDLMKLCSAARDENFRNKNNMKFGNLLAFKCKEYLSDVRKEQAKNRDAYPVA